MRHKSLSEYRTAKWQARRERDHYAHSISERWEALKDPDTRGILLRDAAGDALRSWGPYSKVHDLLHGKVSGSTVASVGTAVASMLPSFKKRLLFGGLSMLMGKWIGDDPDKKSNTLSSVATGIGTVVQFLRHRRERRAAEAAAEVEA
ncbi:MAG: hypothetical protein ABI599_11645 [Flavobacteriales bacterium]